MYSPKVLDSFCVLRILGIIPHILKTSIKNSYILNLTIKFLGILSKHEMSYDLKDLEEFNFIFEAISEYETGDNVVTF
jgi:hypothetical protein